MTGGMKHMALTWKRYKIFYKYNGSISERVYSDYISTWYNDPEYAWRTSPLNKPHTTVVKIEEVG